MEMAVGEPLQTFQEGTSPLKSRLRGYQKQCCVRKLPPRGAKRVNIKPESPTLPSAPVPSPDPVSISAQPQKPRGAGSDPRPTSCARCSSFTCVDRRRTSQRRREQARDLPLLSGSSLLAGCSLPGRCPLPGVSDKARSRPRCSPLTVASAASPPSTPSFCVSPTFSVSTSFLSSLASSWSKQSRRPSVSRQNKRTSGAGAAAQLHRVDPAPRPPQSQPPPPPLPPSSLLRSQRVPRRLVPVTIHFPEDYCTKIHVHF